MKMIRLFLVFVITIFCLTGVFAGTLSNGQKLTQTNLDSINTKTAYDTNATNYVTGYSRTWTDFVWTLTYPAIENDVPDAFGLYNVKNKTLTVKYSKQDYESCRRQLFIQRSCVATIQSKINLTYFLAKEQEIRKINALKTDNVYYKEIDVIGINILK